jgi:hypothetical protein
MGLARMRARLRRWCRPDTGRRGRALTCGAARRDQGSRDEICEAASGVVHPVAPAIDRRRRTHGTGCQAGPRPSSATCRSPVPSAFITVRPPGKLSLLNPTNAMLVPSGDQVRLGAAPRQKQVPASCNSRGSEPSKARDMTCSCHGLHEDFEAPLQSRSVDPMYAIVDPSGDQAGSNTPIPGTGPRIKVRSDPSRLTA